MNKLRIIGIIVLLLGVIGNMKLSHPIISFATGAMVVIGIVLLVTGKPFLKKRN